MRLKTTAVIAMALSLLGLGFVFSVADAHQPGISATCDGVHITGTNYEANKTNTWSVTIGGTTKSGTFGATLDMTFPVPQDGATTSWSPKVADQDRTPDYTKEDRGSVGPCGTAPPKADAKFSVSTTPATCTSGEILKYGPIQNATYDSKSTPNNTVGPKDYSVSATPTNGHEFPSSQQNPITGKLSGPLTGSACDKVIDTKPSVDVVDKCGTADDLVTLSKSAEYTGVDDGKGTATFTAAPGYTFPGGAKTYTVTYKVPTNEVCPPSPPTAPELKVTNTCNTYAGTIKNPTNDTVTYTVTVNGVSTPVVVGAGQEVPFSGKGLSESTPYTLVVSVNGTPVASKDFTTDKCQVSPPPTTAPRAQVSANCSGFTTVLDNTGSTERVIYTVTTPAGVDVQIPVEAKSTYTPPVWPIQDHTTSSVAVRATNLAPVTSTYTANCSSVSPPPPSLVPPTVTPPTTTVVVSKNPTNTSTTTGTLPNTGNEVRPGLAALGLWLLLGGLVMVGTARLRARRS